MMWRHLIPGVICISLTACTIPQDSSYSWQKATVEELSIGVIDNPPFAYKSNSKWEGIEIDLIKKFAAMYGLDVSFTQANETQLFKDLKNYKYQIVLGGIEEQSIWKKEVALTLAYDSVHVMAIPKGENELLFHLENYLHSQLK